MIEDAQLNDYREQGTVLRVIRDVNPDNDVKGIVVAWNEEKVLIRKQNRNVVSLPRQYRYQPFAQPRELTNS